MKKAIPKILSIPPYLSTPWENVVSLQTQKSAFSYNLLVTLKNGDTVKIPNLDQAAIKMIFDTHALYTQSIPTQSSPSFQLEGPIDPLSHNPEQSNLPNLPPEILEKVKKLAQSMGFEDNATLPSPEPDCNCVHCQLARAFHKAPEEETVSEEDLQFRDWEIQQIADKLYTVTSPLDPNEQYNVFLGTPLGCTCGQKNCEHIEAVLKS